MEIPPRSSLKLIKKIGVICLCGSFDLSSMELAKQQPNALMMGGANWTIGSSRATVKGK
jgi:hypothetical protein